MRKILIVCERMLVGFTMMILIAAALGKLLDPGGFRASLDSWSLIPESILGMLTLGVPLLEISLAAAWFLGVHRLAMALAAGVLLAAFTGLYALHLAIASPPDCNCLGLIMAFNRGETIAENLLVRNGVLMGVMALAGISWLVRTRGIRVRPIRKGTSQMPRGAAAGFTLVETLLVIMLIAILIGLALPFLGGARDKAHEVGALALIRGHGQIMQTYSVDYAGYFPVVGHPDRPTTVEVGGREIELTYWHADFQWVYALANGYYDGRLGHPSLYPPGYEDGGSPFMYTESFLAAPQFWSPQTRTGRTQWRPVPAALASYPSAKGLLTSWASRVPVQGQAASYRFPDDMPQETAFVDGSAKTIKRGDFLPWMQTGEGDYSGHRTTPFGWPVLHTLQGAQGRDVN